MKYFWRKFRTNELFLSSYLLLHTALLVCFCLIARQIEFNTIWKFEYTPYYLIPLALIIGLKLPTIMHNAVHGNFKRFNFIIGELSSQLILVSFGIVCINHTFHHVWPDTDKDPHSPIGKSFFTYFLTCLHSGIGVVKKGYLEYNGESSLTKNLFRASVLLHFSAIPLRLYAWYCLLGSELMLTFFLPAFSIFIFTFAHVNYITHALDEDGNSITLNKNSNIWYRFVNFVADGIYFHKNHHLSPNLYNPQQLKEKESCTTGVNLRKIRYIS